MLYASTQFIISKSFVITRMNKYEYRSILSCTEISIMYRGRPRKHTCLPRLFVTIEHPPGIVFTEYRYYMRLNRKVGVSSMSSIQWVFYLSCFPWVDHVLDVLRDLLLLLNLIICEAYTPNLICDTICTDNKKTRTIIQFYNIFSFFPMTTEKDMYIDLCDHPIDCHRISSSYVLWNFTLNFRLKICTHKINVPRARALWNWKW